MISVIKFIRERNRWRALLLILLGAFLASLHASQTCWAFEDTLSQIGLDPNVSRQVRRLANMANQAGLRGLVCSPREVAELRQMLPASTQLVIPGIRPQAVAGDDQKRTLTPRDALALGANWLVIGRPICAAENPRAAAEQILKEIAE